MRPQEETKKLQELEVRISGLLRMGVLISGGCLVLGWIGQLTQGGQSLLSFSSYHPEPLLQQVQWAVLMQDRSLMMSLIGLMLLVCLPLVRVALTGFLFLLQKEYKLGFMALGVFCILIASFSMGIEL